MRYSYREGSGNGLSPSRLIRRAAAQVLSWAAERVSPLAVSPVDDQGNSLSQAPMPTPPTNVEGLVQRETESSGTSAVTNGRKAFVLQPRHLTDHDVTQPAVVRMLIDENERLKHQVASLEGFRDRYFAADKRSAILEERAKRTLAGEVISEVSSTLAGACLGYATAVWPQQPTAMLFLVVGTVLVMIGIAARIIWR